MRIEIQLCFIEIDFRDLRLSSFKPMFAIQLQKLSYSTDPFIRQISFAGHKALVMKVSPRPTFSHDPASRTLYLCYFRAKNIFITFALKIAYSTLPKNLERKEPAVLLSPAECHF